MCDTNSDEYAEDTESDKDDDDDDYNDEEQPSPPMHVQALRIHQH
jgi:hypothetical protein